MENSTPQPLIVVFLLTLRCQAVFIICRDSKDAEKDIDYLCYRFKVGNLQKILRFVISFRDSLLQGFLQFDKFDFLEHTQV